MLKIYFDNRVIYLTDNPQEVSGLTSNISYYSGEVRFRNFLDSFVQIPQLPGCALVHSDLNELETSFFACFTPIAAAGGLVFNQNNEIMFIYRNNKWDLPKGKVDEDEAVESAAVREVIEECGLETPKITEKLIDTFHTYKLKGKMMLKKTHWYKMQEDSLVQPKPQLEEYITEAKWINANDLKSVMNNTFPSVRDVLQAYMNTK